MELSSICAVSPTDMSGGAFMVSLTILILLAGALLGLRFSVYVLVFAIYFGTAVIAGVAP